MTSITIERADMSAPIFEAQAGDILSVRAGTIIHLGDRKHAFEIPTVVSLPAMIAGADYAIHLDEGELIARPCDGVPADAIGGFHFAPAGNAVARVGGKPGAAINPFSIWDVGFRPACADPRGMTLVDGKFWADIYLLGINHLRDGTSRCLATIADGVDRPIGADEKPVAKLDYATAAAIYAHHGKGLLGAEEFFAAAYGVTERQSRDEEPDATGSLVDNAIGFISRWGLFDATGTMWQWGTDGDPDNPRASVFGGSWVDGSCAGSRCADLGYWPVRSGGSIGARGRSDHMKPAA